MRLEKVGSDRDVIRYIERRKRVPSHWLEASFEFPRRAKTFMSRPADPLVWYERGTVPVVALYDRKVFYNPELTSYPELVYWLPLRAETQREIMGQRLFTATTQGRLARVTQEATVKAEHGVRVASEGLVKANQQYFNGFAEFSHLARDEMFPPHLGVTGCNPRLYVTGIATGTTALHFEKQVHMVRHPIYWVITCRSERQRAGYGLYARPHMHVTQDGRNLCMGTFDPWYTTMNQHQRLDLLIEWLYTQDVGNPQEGPSWGSYFKYVWPFWSQELKHRIQIYYSIPHEYAVPDPKKELIPEDFASVWAETEKERKDLMATWDNTGSYIET